MKLFFFFLFEAAPGAVKETEAAAGGREGFPDSRPAMSPPPRFSTCPTPSEHRWGGSARPAWSHLFARGDSGLGKVVPALPSLRDAGMRAQPLGPLLAPRNGWRSSGGGGGEAVPLAPWGAGQQSFAKMNPSLVPGERLWDSPACPALTTRSLVATQHGADPSANKPLHSFIHSFLMNSAHP